MRKKSKMSYTYSAHIKVIRRIDVNDVHVLQRVCVNKPAAITDEITLKIESNFGKMDCDL